MVVSEKINNVLRISAFDGRAGRLGLYHGMPLADARAMVPALSVTDADPQADANLLHAIADWCDRFTPLVALDAPDGLLLDISGCVHLFGGEVVMADTIVSLLKRLGLQAQCAIAGTAVAARALAHYAAGTIAAPGRESIALMRLPAAALNVDGAIVKGLHRAGLKTIGDVISRPWAELAARFGSAFTAVLDQALGLADAPISPRKPPADYMVEKRFAEPVATDTIIIGCLVTLAEMLTAVLERHGEGARRIEAVFFRTDGAVRTIAIETGQPACKVAVIERLFREKLDALADPLDPGFGFDLIRLSANRTVAVVPAQRGFDTSAHELEEVDALVDRLAARYGRHRIVRYLPQDTHIPERVALAVPAQQATSAKVAWPLRIPEEPPRRPLRMFERPEMIDVTAMFPDGPPAQFKWRQQSCVLVRVEGPERIAMEWWNGVEQRKHFLSENHCAVRDAPQPETELVVAVDGRMMTRDYFRAEDKAGTRYWLYREGVYPREVRTFRWFLHGLFA